MVQNSTAAGALITSDLLTDWMRHVIPAAKLTTTDVRFNAGFGALHKCTINRYYSLAQLAIIQSLKWSIFIGVYAI